MITSYKYKTLTWVDVESPTADDVKKLIPQYRLPPIVADELLRPMLRSKIDVYNDLVYFVLHFPIYDISKKISDPQEIDFIVGKNFIITTHYKSIIPLHELIKTFEVGILLNENHAAKNTGRLIFSIIKTLYGHALRELDNIYSKIIDIEKNMFTDQEKAIVKDISYIQRDVLEFQRAIHAHDSVLRSLEEVDSKIMGKDSSRYLKNVIWELSRVEGMLENAKETIELLRDTNDSLLSSRTNEIMKTLTIVTFVTFPALFISSLMSMNTKWLPVAGLPGDFFIVVAIMITGVLAAFTFFRKKRWI